MVCGLAFSYFNGTAERDHAERLATEQRDHDVQMRRSERRYEDRRETYLDLLRALILIGDAADLTEPFGEWIVPPPEPPDPPSDDVWRDIRARVTALGSNPVNEATDAVRAKQASFVEAVAEYRFLRDNRAENVMDAAQHMADLRGVFIEAAHELQALVREELAAL